MKSENEQIEGTVSEDTRTKEQIEITNLMLNNAIKWVNIELSKLVPESEFKIARSLLEDKRKEYQSYLTLI